MAETKTGHKVKCPKCGNEAVVDSTEETGAERENPVVCSGNFAVEDGAVVDYKEYQKKVHPDEVLGYSVTKKGE